jgi:hypothetical protein
MLVLPQKVDIKLSSNNIKYFEKLKYEIPKYLDSKKNLRVKRGTIVSVKVEDLPKGSNVYIKVYCDYCLEKGIKTIIKKKYNDYIYQNEKSIIHKDCCWDCRPKKLKESNLLIYGVTCTMQVEEIKNKCNFNRKYNLNDIYNEFKRRGFIPLFNRYTTIEKLPYVCTKHYQDGIQKVLFHALLNNNGGCRKCGYEKMAEKERISYNLVYQLFKNKNYILLSDVYINNNSPLIFVCEKHSFEEQQTSYASLINNKYNCKYCYMENNYGENSSNWKGGITPLLLYLRNKLNDWKKDSLKFYKYKCILTGKKIKLKIHHPYSYTKIVKDTLEVLELPIYNEIGRYTEQELLNIQDKFLELNYFYGFGVPLCGDLHNLFHSIYKRGNNTKEQLEEFCQRYYSGEFDNLLLNELKLCNI